MITLGRNADSRNILATEIELKAAGVQLHKASRGGDVTFHGPGQLVAYPIFPLRGGVVAHVCAMAKAVISVLAGYGVTAVFRREQPGVWVNDAKVCAFGVHVQRRIAIHGLAFNISTSVSAFDGIIPCGLAGKTVTSLAALTGLSVDVQQVVPAFAKAMAAAFAMELHQADECTIAKVAASAVSLLPKT